VFSKSIQKLIDIFSKFPTVGPRTASRFVFYLIKQPKEKIEELVSAIQELKNKIKYCDFCFQPFEALAEEGESESLLCPICQNMGRDRGLLCIVEKESDLITIEKIPISSRTHGEVGAKKYKGLYFILGGNVATLKKSDVENLRIKELEERLRNPQSFGVITIFKEIIVATNPTPEGKATAILVEKKIKDTLKEKTPKITHLGLGLPVGAELEYADEETLESAFEGRK